MVVDGDPSITININSSSYTTYSVSTKQASRIHMYMI